MNTFPAALLLLLPALSAAAQQPGRALTDADYRRAESLMSYRTEPLIAHTVTDPRFLPGNRFWYRDNSPAADGTPHATYLLVDPGTKSSSAAFDHAALARAIDMVLHTTSPTSATDLHLDGLQMLDPDATGHPHTLVFTPAYLVPSSSQPLRCAVTTAGSTCALDPSIAAGPDASPPSVVSPDGSRAAFVRDWNLWLRDLKTGSESQLTRDGFADFGYATANAGWIHSDKAILLWSPDSRHIATFRQDQRHTGTMTILPVTTGHPEPETWRYPFVGDKDITTIERVLIDVPSGRVVKLKMPADQHRSTVCDDVSCGGGWTDVQWAPDSRSLAFVSTSRDHRDEWLRTANLAGDVHTVFHESAPQFFDSGVEHPDWRYLPASDEFLWSSERSGFANLYLYSLSTGKLKHAVTSGDGNVTDLLSLDPRTREILFLGVGRIPGQQPYFANLFRASLDGDGPPTLLTPGDRDHQVTLSPDATVFVDIASTATEPQVTTLRDTRSGATVMPVTQQDISQLLATGWHPPTPFTVKARDGVTDLYGLLYLPSKLDASAHYPIVDYIYPGPVGKSCPDPSFHAAAHDNQALAELGFVVFCLDGMGTAFRSKAFHTAYYGHLGDNTLPDQITGIRQLAAAHPYIDLARVGIWGHSGGGAATAAAMFHYPDFFQVGISESGNHDERLYEDDWAEKWAGLPMHNTDGSSNYDAYANQNFAKNLRGHLLLAHGTSDDNVPLNNTLLVVDALIKANKDFDLLLLPNAHHGYGDASPYMMRRRWDYFTRYLAGDTPPHEYLMTSWPEVLRLLAQ